MIWVVATFKSERNITVPDTIVEPFLLDAEYFIKGYITDAAYADASLVTPTDTVAYRAIRKAIADLTMVYLRQNNLIAPVAESYKESYNGVVEYEISSGGKTTTTLASGMTKAVILATLAAWRRPLDATLTISSGTGRFMSSELTIVTDEDDDD
jgi:hypothetical protein